MTWANFIPPFDFASDIVRHFHKLQYISTELQMPTPTAHPSRTKRVFAVAHGIPQSMCHWQWQLAIRTMASYPMISWGQELSNSSSIQLTTICWRLWCFVDECETFILLKAQGRNLLIIFSNFIFIDYELNVIYHPHNKYNTFTFHIFTKHSLYDVQLLVVVSVLF